MTPPDYDDLCKRLSELMRHRDELIADNAALRDALAWVMRTHVKDGAIINSQHTDTIKAALLAGKEGK